MGAFVQGNCKKKPNVQKLHEQPGSVVCGASVLTSVTLGDMLVTFWSYNRMTFRWQCKLIFWFLETNLNFLQSEKVFPENDWYGWKQTLYCVLYIVGGQMVMEFSDSVMDVDSHERNTSRWKQFSEVRSFYSTPLFLSGQLEKINWCDSLASSITPSWSSRTWIWPWWWHPERCSVHYLSWYRVWAADEASSASSHILWNQETQPWSPSQWNLKACWRSPSPAWQTWRSFILSSTSMGKK